MIDRNKRLLKNQFLKELSGRILEQLEIADNNLKRLDKNKEKTDKETYDEQVIEKHENLFVALSGLSKIHMTRVKANLQAQD